MADEPQDKATPTPAEPKSLTKEEAIAHIDEQIKEGRGDAKKWGVIKEGLHGYYGNKDNSPLQLDANGTLNAEAARQWNAEILKNTEQKLQEEQKKPAKEQSQGTLDTLNERVKKTKAFDTAGRELGEGGYLVFDVSAPDKEKDKDKEERGSWLPAIGAALGMGLLVALFSELGAVGAILLALLAFAVVGGLTGMFGGLFAAPTPEGTAKENEQARGQQIQREAGGPAQAQETGMASSLQEIPQDGYVQVVKVDGTKRLPMSVNPKTGEMLYSDVADKVDFIERDSSGQANTKISAIVENNGRSLRVMEVASVLPDGTLAPSIQPEVPVRIDIDNNGKTTFNTSRMDGARTQAAARARRHTENVALEMKTDANQPDTITSTVGKMVFHGTVEGEKVAYTSATLLDDAGKPVKDSKGKVIEAAFSEPLMGTVDDKRMAQVWNGPLFDLKANATKSITEIKTADDKAVAEALEKERAEFAKMFSNPHITREQSIDRLREHVRTQMVADGANPQAAAMAASAIAREYENNPNSVSAEKLKALPEITALGEEKTEKITGYLAKMHDTINEGLATKPANADDVAVVVPSVPGRGMARDNARLT